MASLFAIVVVLTALIILKCSIAADQILEHLRHPNPGHHHRRSNNPSIRVIGGLTCRETVVVDRSGRGHFGTIQKAIDSVPLNNNGWFCILINKGFYREQVIIPPEKPFIYLRGESRLQTIVDWDGHNSISTSATLIVKANNTRARGLTFVNSYNLVTKNGFRNPIRQGVATMIDADKVAFFRCRFLGLQDTLWDAGGRHYFFRCTIQGAIDFIFGSGQSIYENCSISVNVEALGPGYIGYITAQGREQPMESNGFVFKNCKIGGRGKVYLGRPWRSYARVIFYKTTMSNVIVPQGWDAWIARGQEYQLLFSEIECSGKGANTSQRVGWVNKHAASNLKSFFDISYINSDGWLTTADGRVV